MSKYDDYELESVLHDIKENGFVFISKYKIWRLLGKGSGAAGTFKAFLDVWEELNPDNKRGDLHGFELNGEYFIGHRIRTSSLLEWAGEK